ncbi:ZrgA family zinc uptake protein [Hydrogenovibrio halophilus]|uniref:ZrgA family zinc uptake protein n=1 Tax=Hydrogenovibrio halophilus TaxID=373391 RepID=UPI00035F9EF2|nr:DUF2796 domain-containing protein [Hydrogenovibrio halophilus]
MLNHLMSSLGLLGLLLISSAGLAQNHHSDHAGHHDHEEHSPHVHGLATMQMVLSGQTVLVEAQVPADTLFGFATAPQTPQQQAMLTKRHERLKTSAVRFSERAHCEITDVSWQNPLTDTEHHQGHADVRIAWQYRCETPERLTHAHFEALFDDWPRLETVEWEWLLPDQPANAASVTVGHPNVQLVP